MASHLILSMRFQAGRFQLSQWYLKQKQKSHDLFCSDPIKQVTWSKNNGFHISIDSKKRNQEVPIDFHQSIFNSCQIKNVATDFRKDSLSFFYLISDIKEDQHFPQQCLNMLAQMTFYKSISKTSLDNIMPLSFSTISGILVAMIWQLDPFLNSTAL